VPTCFGDGLIGTWKGWRELERLGVTTRTPRMIAAELFGSLEQALASGGPIVEARGGPTPASSVATPIATYQSLAAVRDSHGLACAVRDADLLALQRQLATDEGLFAEPAGLVSLAALIRLRREGRLDPDATIVALITATGLKDLSTAAGSWPAVPVIESDLADVERALRATYGVRVRDDGTLAAGRSRAPLGAEAWR
jgi:threonine synthase